VVVIISKLFTIMLGSGLVPDGFGCGLSFPIPKVPNKTIIPHQHVVVKI